MTEPVIRVRNLSKCYRLYDRPGDRIKQIVVPPVKRMLGQSPGQFFREFWALKDVSFEIGKGETVGIIGRNGSGKSTLLQLISGTLIPTSGSAQTNGRIAALLELGSGFSPEFTGRENVYMNGAVLGVSKKEIDRRFDDIAAFADIGEFIERPVKTYSSGMMVRLAFAVQAQVEPDILIVDEALAVGDAKFQTKCYERLKQLKNAGTAILLVTHSTEQIVTHCSRALLLDGGCAIESGEPRSVVNTYMNHLFGKKRKTIVPLSPASINEPLIAASKATTAYVNLTKDVFSLRTGYNPHEYRWGDGSALILDFCLWAGAEMYPSAVTTGQKVTLELSVKFLETLVRPILGMTIKSKEGVTIYGVNSDSLDVDAFKALGSKDEVCVIRTSFDCRLAPGDYFISVGIATRKGEEVVPHDRRYDSIHIQVNPAHSFFGLIDLGAEINVEEVIV